MTEEECEVRIGAFEGPLDLLLYLVQKNEVRPEAISIAEIADQFLAKLKDFSRTDLSAAGDFLQMASRLMELKVRELLPKEEQTPEDEERFNEDRELLLRQMREYPRYKQVARELQGMEAENFGTFYRGRPEKALADEQALADANIWQLFRAYQKSLKAGITEHLVHHIELDYVTIEDRQQAISNYLANHGRALFEELLGTDPHPILTTVTFMALMEMIKTDEVVMRQGEAFGPIWLYRKKDNEQFEDEMASETFIATPDPELKPGLLDLVRSREESFLHQKRATIDAVMREAVLWATSGRVVHDEDLMAMLEGRMEISEEASGKEDEDLQQTNESLTESQAEKPDETESVEAQTATETPADEAPENLQPQTEALAGEDSGTQEPSAANQSEAGTAQSEPGNSQVDPSE